MASTPPLGGDQNRAGEVHAFTWALCSVSTIVVAGRMYSRARLTRNLWWDDWCILVAWILDVAISITWFIYANKGYACHLFYLTPGQLADAQKLNIISRCCCIISIAIGKISVALLIERIICPPGAPRPTSGSQGVSKKSVARLKSIDWRKAALRAISGSVALSATVTVILFYVQCRPASALWDHRLLPPNGTAKCWNPILVNTWDLVIASYWSLSDFLLALFPLPLILSLRLPLARKLLLSLLLSMGIFAGIAAAVKTSKVPISVKGKRDFTWQTVELLLWNGIEMNFIIIAACIPTLRPVFLVLLRRGEEVRDFGDDDEYRGAGKSGGIGQHQHHNGRGQSYYFGRQLGQRRRSSIPLHSNASCSTQQATYHSAKTSSSPIKQRIEEQQQRASISDGSTALGQELMPSPSSFNEKDLEANIQISTREMMMPSSRDGLDIILPRPLEIYKSMQLTRTTTSITDNTSNHDDNDCWDLTCASHNRRPHQDFQRRRRKPSPPPLGGNSWQQQQRSNSPESSSNIVDPDAITEVPLSSTPPRPPPPTYHHSAPSSSSSSSRKTSPNNNNNNNRCGLSAPLSEIGRPSPSGGRSRSRSVKAKAGAAEGSSSSTTSSNSSSNNSGSGSSGSR